MCSCDFEVNQTKIKGGCQSGRKLVPRDSKSDLPLEGGRRERKKLGKGLFEKPVPMTTFLNGFLFYRM